ncbi:hypothetical protein RFI_07273 [Reticulomyxa filosa]|uniref:protein-serine/threonine phosphatase n=1 Tax=Reticulomyxa filosa TaxID=46433 RepID=X6NVL0_RETFI|nr:hypothetical protein RFI_07273 [Reticulomyxa filosa]|eukprot:ETO29844.1 hypothetical protein RFI_07273 [Reticulomyxa filosa]
MIVDDTPEIWVNMLDVHRVPKYLFWPDSESASLSSKNKNSSPSQWNEESLTKQNKDNVLLQLQYVCKVCICVFVSTDINIDCCVKNVKKEIKQKYTKALHQLYFGNHPLKSCSLILNCMRKHVLKDCRILFTGLFPSKMDPSRDRHWKFATTFGRKVPPFYTYYIHIHKGAECVSDLDQSVTHVIARDRLTQKVEDALNMSVPVVHVNWLYECMNHLKRVDTTYFERKLKDFKDTPPSMVFFLNFGQSHKKILLFVTFTSGLLQCKEYIPYVVVCFVLFSFFFSKKKNERATTPEKR